MSKVTDLGTFKRGEIPAAIAIPAMVDDEGDPLDLTGYTPRWVYRRNGGAPTEGTVEFVDEIAASNGEATWSISSADFSVAGHYDGELWVDNGTNELVSETYAWRVQESVALFPVVVSLSATVELPDEYITAGDYYSIQFTFEDVDYSSNTMAAEVRASRSVDSDLLATFEIDSQTYDGTDTTVAMHLETVDTQAIADAGRGYWDLQVTIAGQPHTILRGKLIPESDVTA